MPLSSAGSNVPLQHDQRHGSIAGGLSGLAGAVQIMGFTRQASALSASEGYGFEGISVALIGANHPIGCILARSSLWRSEIRRGQNSAGHRSTL